MSVLPAVVFSPERLDAVAATGEVGVPADEQFDRLTRLAAELLHGESAFVSLVTDTQTYMKSAWGAGLDADDVENRFVPIGKAFCPAVMALGGPLVSPDVPQDPRVSHIEQDVMPVGAYCGLPLTNPDGHILGTLCVIGPEPRGWTARDVEVLETVGAAITSELELRAMRRRIARGQERTRLLAGTSELMVGSLRPVAVLDRLTRMTVGTFAYWCTAWVPEDDKLHAVASARTDLEDGAQDGALALLPPIDPEGMSVTARAWRAGRPVHVADLGAALDEDGEARDGVIVDLVRSTGTGGALSVPLVVEGQQIGVLTFLRKAGERAFDRDDLFVAQEIAVRAAQVLAASRRFHEQRESAETLQRALLPVLPVLEGMTSAARYRPGTTDQHVGGDLYDLIDLGAGRIGIAVGDVMGRGLHAAGVMGQLRSALRAYARLDPPPISVVELLEPFVSDLEGPIVTLLYGSYDPATGELILVNAGHPAPLLRKADGTVVSLDGPIGAPLGAGVVDYAASHHRIEPGDVLCLFTDGLVEDRLREAELGIARVADELALGDADRLEVLADVLLEEASDGDDAALLLLRTAAVPDRPEPSTAHDRSLDLDEQVDLPARRARRFLRDTAGAWGLPDETGESAELVVSELVTNAYVHGAAPVSLRLRLTPSMLYVEVADQGRYSPRRRFVSETDEGGRGLELVSAISARWGSRPTRGGKSVWAGLSLDGNSWGPSNDS